MRANVPPRPVSPQPTCVAALSTSGTSRRNSQSARCALRSSVCATPHRKASTMQVTMTVNGESVTADVEPRMLLVHFLRDQLRLTGTHWGCDTSNCRTCGVEGAGEPGK